MKRAENEKYLIIDTENKFYLNPIFIFIKKKGEALRCNIKDIRNMEKYPFYKIEIEITKLCKEKGII